MMDPSISIFGKTVLALILVPITLLRQETWNTGWMWEEGALEEISTQNGSPKKINKIIVKIIK